MAIRQTPSAVVVPDTITGSAYQPRDVIGNKFEIPYAAGAYGAWLGNLTMVDRGSANVSMRVHLFREEPSAYNPTGVAFSLADSDEDAYLGYVDINSWASAGASKMVGQAKNPGLAIFAQSGARNIWGVIEAQASATFGDAANPLRVKMTTLQDSN
jgi:hypothetical protein